MQNDRDTCACLDILEKTGKLEVSVVGCTTHLFYSPMCTALGCFDSRQVLHG